ncbi:MAG: hypothetical protein IJD22_06565 [Clostridia bacterium]|nr:hypothetical protein [Clostridia bacterium]
MKKIIPIVVVVVIVIAAIIIVPKFMHTCDDCGKFFVGSGYEPSVLADFATDLTGDEAMEIICKECAKEHHFLTSEEDLDKFKIDPFN